MLITLIDVSVQVQRKGGIHLPDRQERVVELRHMWVEVLFPNTRPSNEEGGTRDEQQVQDDNSNDRRLKDLEPVDSDKAVDVRTGSVYSLALEEENDGQGGFNGVVESDGE